MNILTFIVPIILGFYMVYLAIKTLDKIDTVKKNGFKKQAKVVKIREDRNTDSDGETTYTYYYTVNFNDKNGREIEKEIEFGVSIKPNRNPPFSMGIVYYIDENNKIEIIFKNNNIIKNKTYFLLAIGISILCFAVYNYNGEIDIILEFINNIFK